MSISDMTLSMAVPLTPARRVDELELRQEILQVGKEQLALGNKLFQLEGVCGRRVTRCPYGVKGQGLGCHQPGRSGSHGKGMMGRLVRESPTFLHGERAV